jgi:hypothetical protein
MDSASIRFDPLSKGWSLPKKEFVFRTLRCWLFAATASFSFGSTPNQLTADSVLRTPNLQIAPAHGNLEIRLQTHLTSYSSRAGTPFQSVVIRSFEINGQVLIPMDSIVSGHVVKNKSVGMGFWRDRASLTLAFDEYTAPNGRVYPLDAKLVSLDNALERVNSKGEIKGIIAASNPNNFIFGVWGVPSMDQFSRSLIGLTGAANQIYTKLAIGPIGAVGILGLRCALLKFPEPEIHLPPGADMTLAVTVTPDDLANASNNIEQPANYRPSPALSAWLQSAPYSVQKRNGDTAGDVINVALVGSRQEVQNAFRQAGWTQADPNTYRNYSHMWGSYNAMTLYPSAPVSMMLYEGNAPAMVFEKSFDSIAKRHHIRIWHANTVDGEDIWVGAATHDTGIGFKLRTARFTHKIDSDIDTERTKVATDLIFAGCSESAGWVDRPNFAANPESNVSTDGSVEVLALQTCSNQPPSPDSPVPARPGNKASRLTRRIVLEARNYIWRENAYYLGYEIMRYKMAHSGTSPSAEQSFTGR